MTLTTAQAFDAFVEKISLTDVQRVDVQAKRQATEGYLRGAFPDAGSLPLSRVILIGSADRSTLIRPLEDIDVMAEFSNKDGVFEQYRNNSGALLQRIRTALQARTSLAQIGARGQAVRLFYQSGAHVDIAQHFGGMLAASFSRRAMADGSELTRRLRPSGWPTDAPCWARI